MSWSNYWIQWCFFHIQQVLRTGSGGFVLWINEGVKLKISSRTSALSFLSISTSLFFSLADFVISSSLNCSFSSEQTKGKLQAMSGYHDLQHNLSIFYIELQLSQRNKNTIAINSFTNHHSFTYLPTLNQSFNVGKSVLNKGKTFNLPVK